MHNPPHRENVGSDAGWTYAIWYEMQLKAGLLCLAGAAALVSAKQPPKDLLIGVTYRPESCPIKSQDGDEVFMHYTGRLWDGTQFDSSHERGKPLSLTLGAGMVIAGWERGLRDMCIGEKRKLQIPPHLGYGDMSMGDIIPAGSTLVFDVELVDIDGKRVRAIREPRNEL